MSPPPAIPTEHRVISPDGRALQVQEAGDPSGQPVLFHHGTPMSRLIYSGWDRTAAEHGVRFLAYDRPGYGMSDRHAGRNVAACAEDVRAIAQHLDIDRLGVIGLSGGGPHALACAALLGDLVPRVVSLAAVAPFDAEGLNWFADTGESNVEETELFLSDPAAARAKYEQDAEDMRTMTAAQLQQEYATIYSPLDLECMEGDFGAFLDASTKLGLALSIEGPWDDQTAFLSPWGFHLPEIATPVRLRQGRQDLMVPYGHGAWIATQIPSVEPLLSEDESHLSLLDHLAEDLAWLQEAL
jgi:pimeloyl-ACP methyl ester carboxylesterase